MLFGNEVLDVTDFKHPGPQNLITDYLKTDIHQQYIEQGHSVAANELVKKMVVGTIGLKEATGKLLENNYNPEGISEEE